MVFDCRAASYLRASAPIGSEHCAPYPMHRARVNLDRRQATAPIGTAASPARPLRWLLRRVPLPPCQPYPSTSTAPPSGISGGGTPDHPDRAGVGAAGVDSPFLFFLGTLKFFTPRAGKLRHPRANLHCRGVLESTYTPPRPFRQCFQGFSRSPCRSSRGTFAGKSPSCLVMFCRQTQERGEGFGGLERGTFLTRGGQ